MTWYAFHGYNNGKAIDASAFDGAELNALGMHGYATEAQAEKNPNDVNVFQAPVVNSAIDDYNNARDISPTVANNPTSPTAPVTAAANGAKTAAKKVVQAAGKVLGNWTIGGISGTNLAIRLVKVIAGGVILIVGLAKLTGFDSKAGSVVQGAVKAAPLL